MTEHLPISDVLSCSKCKRNIVNGCVSRQRHGLCIVPTEKNGLVHTTNIGSLERFADYDTKVWVDQELIINPQLEPAIDVLERFIQQGAPR